MARTAPQSSELIARTRTDISFLRNSRGHLVLHVDLCLHVARPPIQQGWFILPLPHGSHSTLDQLLRTPEQADSPDRSIQSDKHGEFHRARNTVRLRLAGIYRTGLTHES